jgi:DNA-binding transcriptional MerR regulator
LGRSKPLPDKLFFKIGEVADIVGVKPHVLRYWETEFGALKPMKTRGAHRVYRRRDVELAMLVRRLLHDEGYTIPGARKRLKELDKHRIESDPDPNAAREVALRTELLGVREQLERLLLELEGYELDEEEAGRTVTVQSVVPAAVRGTRTLA